MKIGVLSNSFPLNRDDYPGIFNFHFAARLGGLGHEVTVFTPNRPGEKERFPEFETVWLPWSGGKTPLWKMRLYQPVELMQAWELVTRGTQGYVDLVRRKGIEVSLAMWAAPSGYWAMKAAERLDVPYVTWCLGSDIWTHARLPGARQIIRRVLKKSGHLFADGVALARDAADIAGRRVEFLPSTRVLPDPPPEIPPGDEEKVRFLFIGRWEEVKGVDVLLKAFARLDRPDAVLYVFGHGSQEEEYRRLARRLAIEDRVRILGYAPPRTAAAYLKAARCLVIPSRMESVPVVFSDAMQMGAPVIASRVGDLGDLVDRYNVGYSFEAGDAAALARAMEQMSLESRESFSKGIDEARRRFTLEGSTGRFLEVAEGLVGRR